MSTRTVLLEASGYHIKIVGDGDVGSSSAASVVFRTTFDETWDGMGIIAKFTDAAAQTVTEVTITEPTCTLNADGSWDIPMPHEATAYDGNALLSFVGILTDGEEVDPEIIKKQTTKPLSFRVYASGTERTGDNTKPITATDKQQMLAAAELAMDWAGGTAGEQPSETNNAKYYSGLAAASATAAATSETNAETSAQSAANQAAAANTARQQAFTARDEARAAKTAAEAAQGAAEQAKTNAAASATTASTAAVSAGNQAAQALTARQQAVEARNDARDARDEAQTAQAAAETAQSAAETAQTGAETAETKAEAAQTAAEAAQGIAEGAATDAESAQHAAESAQAAAETAEGGAQAAQSAAETAQAAAEAAAQEAEAHKYDAFVTEGVSSATRFHTTLGADAIPTKTALITQKSGTVPMDWTLRRCGKNIFDQANATFMRGYRFDETGEIVTNADYGICKNFIPVHPSTQYAATGLWPPSTKTQRCLIAYYDAGKQFISRPTDQPNKKNPVFTTPSNCYFIRFTIPEDLMKYKSSQLKDNVNIKIEIGSETTNPPAYDGDDYTIHVTALDTPTEPAEVPTTEMGINDFLLFPAGSLDVEDQISAVATMDVTYRLDPTLAYNQLKAAIVAAGS